ncbi:MAG TPA: GDP-mannose 4,6-dehydratase, partial [Candidatus Paceibacterota bacterium]|nr:GDP-mannose 4,6-dehydratase [Candidatus Paceibacterota bacterium]
MANKKTILITGGGGFIGHHFVEGLLKKTDWDIVILDALTYAGNLNRLTDIDIWDKEKHRVKFVWHDLRAPISDTTHKMIGDLDFIWHLAAESHVDRSLEDSRPFVMSNVLGTANLLEYVKKYQPSLKKFVTFSTDEVFGP